MNDKSDKPRSNKIVIEGITVEGDKFRPSDWAERISGKLATFRKQRIVYSPLLRPSMKNGRKCVIVDDILKEEDPQLYQQVIDFAKANNLVMCDELEPDQQDDDVDR